VHRPRLTRRSFLGRAAGASAAVAVAPTTFSLSPNAALQVACIGVGGMGAADLRQVASGRNVQIAALCDVDGQRLGAAAGQHEGARTFTDYRRLLDDVGKDLDAVVVSTPDHMHGPITIAAMELGKHVYCQKPIAHNLGECRRMAELAEQKGLVTQMGTQIHAHAAYRTAEATLRRGVIGKVREAHLWVGKSWGGPPEGRPDKKDPVPAHLDWDLWLGVAPERPYVREIYHPFHWRGWLDFGSGTLGDMGCHIFDPVFSALDLGPPLSAVSRGPGHHEETFASDGDVLYEFAGTARTTGPFTMRWTDGKAKRADELAQLPGGATLPGSGSFLVGEKGVMVIPHWSTPRCYRDGEVMAVELEERDSVNHYHEWTDACRGEGRTTTPFSYSGPLTEAVLLGTVAGRVPGRRLGWDPDRLTIDHDDAQRFVTRTYRPGWEVRTR